MTNGKGNGCLKGTAVGCGSCLVLCIIAAVSVWAGWGTIREIGPFKNMRTMVETAKGEAENMTALSSTLEAKLPADDVDVRANFNSVNGTTTRSIQVAIVGPQFAMPESGAEKSELALRIARTIADSYPTLDKYDELHLSIVIKGSGPNDLGSTSNYQFPTADLIAPPKPAP